MYRRILNGGDCAMEDLVCKKCERNWYCSDETSKLIRSNEIKFILWKPRYTLRFWKSFWCYLMLCWTLMKVLNDYTSQFPTSPCLSVLKYKILWRLPNQLLIEFWTNFRETSKTDKQVRISHLRKFSYKNIHRHCNKKSFV